jgi:AraC-like DNA-binding protein
VEVARDIETFIRDPLGKCTAGRGWLYFHPIARLCGFVLWGQLEADDLRKLAVANDIEIQPDCPSHNSLVDVRTVEVADMSAFAVLAEYLIARRESMARSVERLALVHPGGYIGALATGFFQVTTPPYPVAMFDDPVSALAWLGVEVPLADEIDKHVLGARVSTPMLRDLRLLLDAADARLALGGVAAQLGVSTRALQLRLAQSGTSFRRELQWACVRRGQTLLTSSRASLTEIALEVGCASLPHFSALFKKLVGVSPGRWRASRLATGRS